MRQRARLMDAATNRRAGMNQYARSSNGHVIHRVSCNRKGRHGKPWPYADGFSAFSIANHIEQYPWLRACLLCRPDVGPVARQGGEECGDADRCAV
jgi:hypothetical protein